MWNKIRVSLNKGPSGGDGGGRGGWSHLICWGVEGKQLRVAPRLPRLVVEAVQLLRGAEPQQPLYSGVRGQTPQVKVRRGQSSPSVLTEACQRRGLHLEVAQRRRGRGVVGVCTHVDVSEWLTDRVDSFTLKPDFSIIL